MEIVNCSRYSRLSDTQFVHAPWWGVSKPPEKMFVFTGDMTIERTQVWNTMSNVNSIIPLAISVNDFFMIHCKSRSMRRTTLEKKLKKKREESFLFLAAEFQPFFPFSSSFKYRIKSRYGYPWKFIWNYVPVYLRIERKRWRLFDVPFPEIGFNLRPERVNELFLLSFHTNCPPRSFPFVFQRSYVSYSHNRFSRFHF